MTEEQARAVAIVAQAHNADTRILEISNLLSQWVNSHEVGAWHVVVPVGNEEPVTIGSTESLMYWMDEH